MGLTDEISFLIPDDLNGAYKAHFFIMLAVYFLLVGIAAMQLKFFNLAMKKLIELKNDKFTQILAYEQHPFIVFT